MPENHEKSEVISDRLTDRQTGIVNYRVALTRLKMLNCKVGRGSKYKSEWHKQEESSFLDGTQEISCGDLRYTHDLVIVMSTLVIHKTSIHSQQFDIISFIHSFINQYLSS